MVSSTVDLTMASTLSPVDATLARIGGLDHGFELVRRGGDLVHGLVLGGLDQVSTLSAVDTTLSVASSVVDAVSVTTDSSTADTTLSMLLSTVDSTRPDLACHGRDVVRGLVRRGRDGFLWMPPWNSVLHRQILTSPSLPAFRRALLFAELRRITGATHIYNWLGGARHSINMYHQGTVAL